MKKYAIFAISFILLFTLFFGAFEVLSGMILTSMYTPNVGGAWSSVANLPQEIIVQSSQNPFILTSIIAFFAATIAYFVPTKVLNKTSN